MKGVSNEYSIKKTTVEQYEIRVNSEWAFITLDSDKGIFQAHSSYGDYGYSWPKHGRKNFKDFVLELVKDKEYFLGKVSSEDCFYNDKT